MLINIDVEIDNKLYDEARTLMGRTVSDTELVENALATFIHLKAAQRLALLGKAQPNFEDVPKRR